MLRHSAGRPPLIAETADPMRIADLPTPSLVLDRRVLDANLARMRGRAAELGVTLRPHLKTAKSDRVARLAHGGETGPITVSTLAEAAYFLDRGFADMTYAVGVTPDKLPALAELTARGASIGLLTDDLEAARAIGARGAELGLVFPVHVEVDSGSGRGGLAPGDPALVEIGRVVDTAPGASLRGVLTHAGMSYQCDGPAAIRVVAERERADAVAAADALRAAGLPCSVVSVGSTPTAAFAESLDGVTEMRPGVYMFMDLFQAELGVCGESDIAVSVTASVVGHKPAVNRLLIDAGALALSQDSSLPGYGRVAGAGDLRIASVHQEHGFVEGPAPLPFDRYPVGARLRVLPNHACMTAAMYDRYYVVDGGDEVVDEWDRCRGW